MGDRLKDDLPAIKVEYRPLPLLSLPRKREREGRGLFAKLEYVPIKSAGAVEIIDKNAHRT